MSAFYNTRAGGGMADATDLKSVDRKVVGVRLPLRPFLLRLLAEFFFFLPKVGTLAMLVCIAPTSRQKKRKIQHRILVKTAMFQKVVLFCIFTNIFSIRKDK